MVVFFAHTERHNRVDSDLLYRLRSTASLRIKKMQINLKWIHYTSLPPLALIRPLWSLPSSLAVKGVFTILPWHRIGT